MVVVENHNEQSPSVRDIIIDNNLRFNKEACTPAIETDIQSQADSDAVSRAGVDGGLGEGLGLITDNDYFDISSFMADQTLVEVVTQDICPYGGFADKNSLCSGVLHLPKGQHLQLPLVTAAILHARQFVLIQLPVIFEEAILTNLRRNPIVVDIRSLHPYYFELGMKLAAIFKDGELAQTLMNAVEERMIFLMELAHNEVENEQKVMQSTGGLVQSSIPSETRGAAGHMATGAPAGKTSSRNLPSGSADGNSNDTVFGTKATGSVRNRSVNVGLFLKGISVPESIVFQKRKEEILASLSYSLL